MLEGDAPRFAYQAFPEVSMAMPAGPSTLAPSVKPEFPESSTPFPSNSLSVLPPSFVTHTYVDVPALKMPAPYGPANPAPV